ncbi:MAG: hypothetical protein ABSD81_04545 [Methanomicrobiales archaeon]
MRSGNIDHLPSPPPQGLGRRCRPKALARRGPCRIPDPVPKAGI